MATSPASLRRKIGSAGDLQSVVRAMKAQAAASVGQYEESVKALGEYAHTVELGLGACFRQSRLVPNPPVRRAERPIIQAVIFGSDQGLVGRFNDIVLDHAREVLSGLGGNSQVWAVGERVRGGVVDSGLPLLGVFPVPGSVREITSLVTQILIQSEIRAKLGDAGSTPELHLFYNRPTSGSAYGPVSQRLLPLDETWRRAWVAMPWPTAMLPETMGDATSTLMALIREYMFVSIFRASAESLASENASRLASMDRADKNIDKMLVKLHDEFHRLRQSSIDEELSDVIAGFKALRQTQLNSL